MSADEALQPKLVYFSRPEAATVEGQDGAALLSEPGLQIRCGRMQHMQQDAGHLIQVD